MDHCRDIVLRAEANGFDNVLLPSGYALGMDATAFAAAIAVETSRIKLLLAVRLGELVVPQLARQIATLQQIAGGRLVINAISSDVPGETLSSEARYQRTTESLAVLRALLCGERADFDGAYVTAHVDAPRIAVDHPHNPVVYFGGLSEAARQCAAESCDVYLMWPDRTERMRAVIREMDDRAAAFGRTLRYSRFIRDIDAAETSIISNETEVELVKYLTPVLSTTVTSTPTSTSGSLVSLATSGVVSSGQNVTIDFKNPLRNDVPGKGAEHLIGDIHIVSSSTFTYNGLANCRLEDNGDGIMRIINTSGTQHRTILDIGTVDYDTGIIRIDNFNITNYTGTSLKVYAKPRNLDITSSQNVILNILENDVDVTIEQIRE